MIAPLIRADRVRLELDLAIGVEALDRADQPEQAVRDEILLVDVRGQRRTEPPGDELDERRVRQDQPVANAWSRVRRYSCQSARVVVDLAMAKNTLREADSPQCRRSTSHRMVSIQPPEPPRRP